MSKSVASPGAPARRRAGVGLWVAVAVAGCVGAGGALLAALTALMDAAARHTLPAGARMVDIDACGRPLAGLELVWTHMDWAFEAFAAVALVASVVLSVFAAWTGRGAVAVTLIVVTVVLASFPVALQVSRNGEQTGCFAP